MARAIEDSWDGILEPNETVLWQAQPQTTLDPGALQWGKALMGLFFAGFSIFWMMLAAQAGGPFWMLGLIFLGIGLRNVLGPFLLDPWLRGETFYTLTSHRAFIATRSLLKGRVLHVYEITAPNEIDLVQGRTDSLFFDAEQPFGRKGHRLATRVAFENLADGRAAQRVLTRIAGRETGVQPGDET